VAVVLVEVVTVDVVFVLDVVAFPVCAKAECQYNAGNIPAAPSKIIISANPSSRIFNNCELIWCYISAFEN